MSEPKIAGQIYLIGANEFFDARAIKVSRKDAANTIGPSENTKQ